MKHFFLIMLTLVCGATVIAGNLYWNDKTAVTGSSEPVAIPTETDNEPDVPEETPAPADDADQEKLIELASQWPEEAQQSFKESLDAGEPFKILLAGSDAAGNTRDHWSVLLQAELEAAYGDSIEVAAKHYPLNSREFIEEELTEELAAFEPDLTLLEPFTLMDNGEVAISDSHRHLDMIAEALDEANPDHTLIIQPPYPLYRSSYYPVQVDALKEYAESNYLYLDHWTAWPDQNSQDMNDYLTEVDGDTYPNDQGHQLWAEFLIEYFISGTE